MSYTERLFTLFEDAEVSWDAARAIGGIVRIDKVLTKRNNAIVKVCSFLKECGGKFSSDRVLDPLRPEILQFAVT